jgi:hypothetical protein
MMAREPNNLVVEILRRLQADMADLKEGQRAANVHLAAIESHMGRISPYGERSHR